MKTFDFFNTLIDIHKIFILINTPHKHLFTGHSLTFKIQVHITGHVSVGSDLNTSFQPPNLTV